MDILYIRTSMLLIAWGGRRILTDPWFAMHMRGLPVFVRPCARPEDLPPIDLVLVSHFHPDHFDQKAVRRLTHPVGSIVGPPGLARKCSGVQCSEIVEMRDGESREIGGWRISSWSVEHSGYENAYFVAGDDSSLFFSGDAKYSDVFQKIGKQCRPTVALLPVGGTEILGRRIVMDTADALRAGRDLGACAVVPIHHGGEWMSVPPLSRHPGRARRFAELAESENAPFHVALLMPGESAAVDAEGVVTPVDKRLESL